MTRCSLPRDKCCWAPCFGKPNPVWDRVGKRRNLSLVDSSWRVGLPGLGGSHGAHEKLSEAVGEGGACSKLALG